ncbi:hypothetical protein V1264_022365 [Littorina saxatilis]|uniref:Uncharacterized protein n=1 Tax=Littorina saxatilis TaxID=31220 RepID=A0AAN9FXL7_9CAEN
MNFTVLLLCVLPVVISGQFRRRGGYGHDFERSNDNFRGGRRFGYGDFDAPDNNFRGGRRFGYGDAGDFDDNRGYFGNRGLVGRGFQRGLGIRSRGYPYLRIGSSLLGRGINRGYDRDYDGGYKGGYNRY